MKIVFSLFFTCACLFAKAQLQDLKPEFKSNKIIMYHSGSLNTARSSFKIDSIPNGMAVTPQLLNKAGNNGRGFDVYIMRDGMSCLVPDSSFRSNMPVVGKRSDFTPFSK